MLVFTVPGNPQGKARARTVGKNGHVHSYTPDNTVLYENLIKTCYLNAGGGIYNNKEPVGLSVIAYYPIPKSTSKKDRAKMLERELLPTKKPDADNVLKVVNDALNGLAYSDDSQICVESIEKYYDLAPRLEIIIENLKESKK